MKNEKFCYHLSLITYYLSSIGYVVYLLLISITMLIMYYILLIMYSVYTRLLNGYFMYTYLSTESNFLRVLVTGRLAEVER